jgi:hypothetical protein
MSERFALMEQAWTLHSVAEVLHAAMPEDKPETIPARSVVAHLCELAQTLAEAIESSRIPHARTTNPMRQADARSNED